MYKSFQNGRPWLDTSGKPIQAHGFSVFHKDGVWYWYGENKEFTNGKNGIWHWGVRLYTSTDLYNWEDKGLIIQPDENDVTSPLHPAYCVDRPHILFCKKTGKYVAWLKVMAGEISQFFTVMEADAFEGPYTFVQKVYHPLQMDSGDFCFYTDEATQKAYIWFERPHFQLVCATLNEDYTALSEEYSIHYDGLLPPFTREAPTFFQRNGKKYLFTSGTTSYCPNRTQVCMFDDCHGEYVDLGDPCVGDRWGTTFNCQITSVIQIPGTDQYIACADRWIPKWNANIQAKKMFREITKHFRDYVPDTAPRYPQPLTGMKNTFNHNTSISQYVWLPIEWEGDKPVIRWHRKWKLK